MFVKLSLKAQETILCIKINEIDMSDEYTDQDKAQMIAYYRKKLKQIQPKRNF